MCASIEIFYHTRKVNSNINKKKIMEIFGESNKKSVRIKLN